MNIYRERERDREINLEEKENQGVPLLITKSAEVTSYESSTVPNIQALSSPTFSR